MAFTIDTIRQARQALEENNIAPEPDGYYRFYVTRDDAPGLLAAIDSAPLVPGDAEPPKHLQTDEEWLGSIAGVHVIAKNRHGDWMQTYTGRQFWPLDPRQEEVHIEDIAHALSMICRFGGHCNKFYSVAEHSCRASHLVRPESALVALLHDATEAYVGDMVRPIKRFMPAYKEAELKVWHAIAVRFSLPANLPTDVLEADEIMLATEARDVMGGGCAGKWGLRQMPLTTRIEPWSQVVAVERFLDRFYSLYR